jgi:glycosyltransferase involved in cell wall biosynthesis
MNKIKILLQYPWKFPDSSYYKNILEFDSQDFEFVNYVKSNKKMEIIGSSKEFEQMRKIKNFFRKILNVFKIPNLTYSFSRDFDLIHCAHCLSLNKKPWIVDTETYDRVTATGNIAFSKLGKWIIKNRLESKYCKRILCWSEDCKKTFEEAFKGNATILEKITLVQFGLKENKFKKIKHSGINILFVARWFDAKGGRQTLEVFDRLTKKNKDLNCIFICPTPKEFREKYSKNKQIKILDLMPQEKLFKEVYPKADIFFYPGFGDSYGFAIPEALSFGLPIISSKTFAKEELVQENETGFLIDLPKNWKGYEDMDEKMIQDFVRKTQILIQNKEKRESFSKKARLRAKEFHSIKKVSEKLKKIYEEALRGVI